MEEMMASLEELHRCLSLESADEGCVAPPFFDVPPPPPPPWLPLDGAGGCMTGNCGDFPHVSSMDTGSSLTTVIHSIAVIVVSSLVIVISVLFGASLLWRRRQYLLKKFGSLRELESAAQQLQVNSPDHLSLKDVTGHKQTPTGLHRTLPNHYITQQYLHRQSTATGSDAMPANNRYHQLPLPDGALPTANSPTPSTIIIGGVPFHIVDSRPAVSGVGATLPTVHQANNAAANYYHSVQYHSGSEASVKSGTGIYETVDYSEYSNDSEVSTLSDASSFTGSNGGPTASHIINSYHGMGVGHAPQPSQISTGLLNQPVVLPGNGQLGQENSHIVMPVTVVHPVTGQQVPMVSIQPVSRVNMVRGLTPLAAHQMARPTNMEVVLPSGHAAVSPRPLAQPQAPRRLPNLPQPRPAQATISLQHPPSANDPVTQL